MIKTKLLNIIKLIGLLSATSAASFSCVIILGQDKLPCEVEKLRRF